MFSTTDHQENANQTTVGQASHLPAWLFPRGKREQVLGKCGEGTLCTVGEGRCKLS